MDPQILLRRHCFVMVSFASVTVNHLVLQHVLDALLKA